MEIPFVGGAYLTRSLPLSAQTCINLYPEIHTDDKGAKKVTSLIGTPGTTLFATMGATGSLPVSGLHTMGDFLYAVWNSKLWKIESDGTATDITPAVPLQAGTASMADNGTILAIVIDGDMWTYTVAAGLIKNTSVGSDPVFDTVTYQDLAFVFQTSSDGKIYTTTNPTTESAWANFATAESDPDGLLRVVSDHRELWLFGDETIEVWYNAGSAGFTFARNNGVYIEKGLGARWSVAQLDNSLFWLGDDRMVYRAEGYTPKRVSTSAIEFALGGYSATNIAAALAYSYSQEGHTFYVLTIPNESTWVYDVSTDFWHERHTGALGRHIGNCYASFAGKHIVGDYDTGRLMYYDFSAFLDITTAITRDRTTQVLHADDQRISMHKLYVDFETGVGTGSGAGESPTADLLWSNDGGRTYTSSAKSVSVGEQTDYTARVVWRRLGQFRSRIFNLKVTQPVKVVIMNAVADVTIEK